MAISSAIPSHELRNALQVAMKALSDVKETRRTVTAAAVVEDEDDSSSHGHAEDIALVSSSKGFLEATRSFASRASRATKQARESGRSSKFGHGGHRRARPSRRGFRRAWKTRRTPIQAIIEEDDDAEEPDEFKEGHDLVSSMQPDSSASLSVSVSSVATSNYASSVSAGSASCSVAHAPAAAQDDAMASATSSVSASVSTIGSHALHTETNHIRDTSGLEAKAMFEPLLRYKPGAQRSAEPLRQQSRSPPSEAKGREGADKVELSPDSNNTGACTNATFSTHDSCHGSHEQSLQLLSVPALAVESIPDGVVCMDDHGIIVAANASSKSLLSNELVGMHVVSVIAPSDAVKYLNAVQRLRRSDSNCPMRFMLSFRGPGHQTLQMASSMSRVDEPAAPTRFILQFRCKVCRIKRQGEEEDADTVQDGNLIRKVALALGLVGSVQLVNLWLSCLNFELVVVHSREMNAGDEQWAYSRLVATVARELVIGDGELWDMEAARSMLATTASNFQALVVGILYGSSALDLHGVAHLNREFLHASSGSVSHGLYTVGFLPAFRAMLRRVHDVLRDFVAPADGVGCNATAVLSVDSLQGLFAHDTLMPESMGSQIAASVTALVQVATQYVDQVLEFATVAFLVHFAVVVLLYVTVFRGLVEEVARKVCQLVCSVERVRVTSVLAASG